MHSIARFIGAMYILFIFLSLVYYLYKFLDNLTKLADTEIMSFVLLINTVKLPFVLQKPSDHGRLRVVVI